MKRLRAAMSKGCALLRSEESLSSVLEVCDELNGGVMTSGLRSSLVAAELIVQGALAREESRGGHFRTDFPEEHADWKRRTLVTLDQADAAGAKASCDSLR